MTAPAANPFIDFVARYRDEPVLFVQEVLGGNPDATQSEIMNAVAQGARRVSIRSGHRVGKTTTLAWLIVWHISVKFPQKTICTAPTGPQLYDALASETKAWFKKLPPALLDLYEIKVEEINLKAAPEESFVSFVTSRAETPEALAGKHSEHVLIICDEASGVPEQVYEAAAGSMAGHNACTILAGNPIRTTGHFFDTHHKLRGRWKTFHISCEGHPRITPDFIEDSKAKWGADSNAYRVRVLGEFPTGDDDTVIPLDLAMAALHRDVRPTMVRPVWGVDPARFGSDSTGLAKRRGNTLLCKTEERKGWDTMRVSGWIKSEWDATPPSERPTDINVDVIGIGAGVCDRLIELGLPARGINVSENPAAFSDRYFNLRAELWFKGKDYLGARDCNMAGDEDLVGELVAPRFKYHSNGKIIVESKDDMKKRGVRSPNRADAWLLTLASESISAVHGSKNSHNWNQPMRRPIAGIV